MLLLKPSFTIEYITPDALHLIERAARTCYKSEESHGELLTRRIDERREADPDFRSWCAAMREEGDTDCPQRLALLNGDCVCAEWYEENDKITQEFVKRILNKGHESVLEHASVSVRFIVDRGVSHELVRHRLAAFSQESTRYVNYGKRGGCQFIIPPWFSLPEGAYETMFYRGDGEYVLSLGDIERLGVDTPVSKWINAMAKAESHYLALLGAGQTPQQARSVLPNSTKTEIVMTANLREWRHVLKLRTSPAAHPQMREVMIPLLRKLQEELPVIFDDIKILEDADGDSKQAKS